MRCDVARDRTKRSAGDPAAKEATLETERRISSEQVVPYDPRGTLVLGLLILAYITRLLFLAQGAP